MTSLAPTPLRPVPPRFTAQQALVVRVVRDTAQHVMVRATAGSGKTTTLTEAAWHLPDPAGAVYFVYNKHATQGVQGRLPPGLPARTLHAHGMGQLARTGQALDLQADKTLILLRELGLLDALGEGASPRSLRALTFTALRAWDLYRELDLSLNSADDLALLLSLVPWPQMDQRAGMERPLASERDRAGFLAGVLESLRHASREAFLQRGLIDHTDMLWLPLGLGLGRGQVRTALVDEAQDLTPLRQQFVLHVTGLRTLHPGRLILCGDPSQAIYSYAGADPGGLVRLAREIGARELPLSVSFRCPRSVVAIAQTVSDFIEPVKGAAEGTVEHLPAKDLDLRRGDVVLCRLNAPLIRLALDLLTQGRSVYVTGRDLEARLVSAAQEAFPEAFTAERVPVLVSALQERRAAPMKRALERGEWQAKRQLSDLRDLCRCLTVLAEQVSGQGPGTVDAIRALLATLYRSGGEVTLSTVHKAKGLEWPRVTVLYPELMPLAMGDPEEERCVQFVAYTRAQQTLRFAYGQQAWEEGLRVTGKELPPKPVPEVTPLPAPAPRPAAPRAAPEAPLLIEDERELTLFGGTSVLDVPPLVDRLTALAGDPRPVLQAWAATSLALLRRVPARQVYAREEVLKAMEVAARAARLAIPAFGQPGPRSVRVMVFERGLARWKYAQVNRLGARVVNITLSGETLRFDARTGELLGVPFAPLGLHLDPGALQPSPPRG
ncbi:UvrD-helicase domain-containing protein [Deinococcus aestuarii]|uniref:UvrD-helicase domain-containing protein n=1 Tax=Deinococcus aestuarii TaxID=2774531 RepID=UPI001C0D388B|nr:UvrD-helicase domain-containing protein [Deinococcus aestuarii]